MVFERRKGVTVISFMKEDSEETFLRNKAQGKNASPQRIYGEATE